MPLNPSTLKVEKADQNLTVRLTPHELDMLMWLAKQGDQSPADLLVDFIADLTCSWRTGGSDEREFAFNWYKRRGYTGDYIDWTESAYWRADVEADEAERRDAEQATDDGAGDEQ